MRRIPFSLVVLFALAATLYFWRRPQVPNGNVAVVTPAPTTSTVVAAIERKPASTVHHEENTAPARRAPASKALFEATLPPSLRSRARFEILEGGFPNRRRVALHIDDAEVIGASYTVDDTGEKIFKTHLPKLSGALKTFPNIETDALRDRIESEFKTGPLEPTESILVRKIWLPKRDRTMQAAVEFLVKSRSKDTNQITEEIFQFDPGTNEILNRYDPSRR